METKNKETKNMDTKTRKTRKPASPRVSKKLNLAQMIASADHFDVLKEIELSNGLKTDICTNFSNLRIDEMLADYLKFVESYHATIGKLEDSRTIDYLVLFMLLHFTTITESKNFTFEEKVDIFYKLLKTNLTEEIFESFKQSDVQKVFDRLQTKIDQYVQLVQQNKELKTQLNDFLANGDLENRELLQKTFAVKDDVHEDQIRRA